MMKFEVLGIDLARIDGPAGNITLTMDGFSGAYAKLKDRCEQSAPKPIAVVPWTNRGPVSFMSGAKSAGAHIPPATSDAAVAPDKSGASTPVGPKTSQAADRPGAPAQTELMQQGCGLQIPGAPQRVTGRVTRFVSGEEALTLTNAVEAQLGAKISPAYLSLKRVRVEASGENRNWWTIAAVPEDMPVKVGDLVELNSRYRDPELPCQFIPWTIYRLLDQGGQ